MSGLSINYNKGLEIQPLIRAKKRMVSLLRKQAKIAREIERLNKSIIRKDQL